jgi:predicted nuclease of predicted toxin-antitoxin system
MDIAAPVVHFLRTQGVDILSAREEGWGGLTDSEILAQAHAMARFVLTHNSDFGTLAVYRGEAITGILSDIPRLPRDFYEYLTPYNRMYGGPRR